MHNDAAVHLARNSEGHNWHCASGAYAGVLERVVGGYVLRVRLPDGTVVPVDDVAPAELGQAKRLLEQQIRMQASAREEMWRLNDDPPWVPYERTLVHDRVLW